MADSLAVSVRRARYFIDQAKYKNLVDLLGPELLVYCSFFDGLREDKSEHIDAVEALLDKRESDLETLRQRLSEMPNPDSDFESQPSVDEGTDLAETPLAVKMQGLAEEINQESEELMKGNGKEDDKDSREHDISERFKEYVEQTFDDEPAKKGGKGQKKQGSGFGLVDDFDPEEEEEEAEEEDDDSPYSKMFPLKDSSLDDK